MNKRFLLFLFLLLNVSLITGQDLKGVKVLINPGHGGHDSDDRYIPETGFWESDGNLSKGLYLRDILVNLGATVIMSRVTNNTEDDLLLSDIVAMANDNNVQYMHAIHSNAGGGNYTLMLYQGTTASPTYPDSKTMSQFIGNEIYLAHRTTDLRLAGDFDFYGTGRAYLGVFKGLNMPGSLSEGSMHDYYPESWRLKNQSYLKHEAWAIAKAFLSFWGKPSLSTGILAGIVRDPALSSGYTPVTGCKTSDGSKPINNIKVTLTALDPANTMTPKVYKGDAYNNGFFMFDNLTPGSFKLYYEAQGYFKDSSTVTVQASKNTFADKNLISNALAEVSSIAITPATGDSLYPGNQKIVIQFSRSMNAASVDSAISVSPNAPLSFLWSGDDKVTVSTNSLPYNTAMTLTIAGWARGKYSGVKLDGNKDGMGGDSFTFQFRTCSKDVWAPVVESVYPSDEKKNVELLPLINICFNELLNSSTLTDKVKLVKTAGQTPVAEVTKVYNLSSKTIVSLFPDSALSPDESYSIIVSSGIQDKLGNPTASDIVYNFKTAPSLYTVIPIDNFETNLVKNWASPTLNSPLGIVETETALYSNFIYLNRFSGSRVSLQLRYSWDVNAASWFIRECLIAGASKDVTFTSQNVLQVYVFGDGSNNKFRFCVSDGTNFSGREVSPWYTVDWTGWRLVSWDMSRDGMGTWDGNTAGNGTLDGQLKFDSFQFTHTPGSPAIGSFYFDDLRAATIPWADKDDLEEVPSRYSLKQNYPNPFNPSTTLSYEIPADGFVLLKVFDLLGREVKTIVSSNQKAGSYKVEFNAGSMSSGVYIYTLKAGSFSETKKMLLLK